MSETVETVKEYLENYPKTFSTELDGKFGIFKVDVSSLASDLKKGELYIYSKDDYIEFLRGNENFDWLEEVKKSTSSVFIETGNGEYYYSV